MLALLEHPDAAAAARDADPMLLPVAVEELLRWVSPVKNMSRTVTRDVELRGQQLREGDQVMLFYPSANRDEAVFERPVASTSAATRTPTWPSASAPTSASGPRWPGSSCGSMFREVLRRLPDLALVPGAEPCPIRPSNFVSGPEAMPVRFTPTPEPSS